MTEREHDDLLRAYREVFNTDAGKRVLYDILSMCAVYQSPFTGENNRTNFLLGSQEAGRRVMGRLDEVDPRLYPQLLLAVADMRAMEKEAAACASEIEDDENEA